MYCVSWGLQILYSNVTWAIGADHSVYYYIYYPVMCGKSGSITRLNCWHVINVLIHSDLQRWSCMIAPGSWLQNIISLIQQAVIVLVCDHVGFHVPASDFWESSEVRTGGWVSDSLVVKHHVRQPDVFWGQPDLQHPIKLLRDPSQTIVLPLLRVNKHTVLSQSSAHRTAALWKSYSRWSI